MAINTDWKTLIVSCAKWECSAVCLQNALIQTEFVNFGISNGNQKVE